MVLDKFSAATVSLNPYTRPLGAAYVSWHKDYYYMNEELEDGWLLVAAFCPETRQHWALGRLSYDHPLVTVERNEEEATEFLMTLRPFIKIW